jgi:hypothetical protein
MPYFESTVDDIFPLTYPFGVLAVGFWLLFTKYDGNLGGNLSTASRRASSRLTNRWSGRLRYKVPSPNVVVRADQLNR